MSSGTHQGGWRRHSLDRILRIRRRVYLFLMSVMAGLGAAQIFVKGPTVAPFYFPVGPVIITVLIAALIRTLLGTVFGQIELANIERTGRDRAAERARMRRPFVFALIFGLAAAALLVPSVHTTIVASMTEATNRSLAAGTSSTIPGGLISVDAVGLTRVAALNISTLAGAVEVGITHQGRTVLQVLVSANESWTWTPDASRRLVYTVTLTNPTAADAQFRLTIVRDAFPELFTIVAAALVLVAIANLVSLFRLSFFARHYWDADTVMRRSERPIAADPRRYGIEEGPPRARPSFLNLPTRPQGRFPPARGRRREPAVVLLHQEPAAKRPPKRPARPAPEIRPEALLKEAAGREAKGDFPGALARYDAILRSKPGHAAASLAKATLLRRLNRPADALGVYRELLHTDRDNLAALRGCLAIHEADESWRDALDVVDRILALRPEDAYVHATQGDILVALRRQPEAVAAYARATALRPGDAALAARANRARTDVSLLLSHALVSAGSGNLQAALAAYDDVLRIEGDNLDALAGKSEVLRRLGEVDEARILVEAVLARDSRHSGALLTKSRLPVPSSDRRTPLVIPQRSRSIEELLARDPGHGAASPPKTEVPSKADGPRAAPAISERPRSVEDRPVRDPGARAAALLRMHAPSRTDDARDAPATSRPLLPLDTGDIDALLESGDLLARNGRVKEAFAKYEAALVLHPEDAGATEKLKARSGGVTTDRAVLRELFRIRSLGPARARAIAAAGYRTVDDLRSADVERLAAVPGVGRTLAETIVRYAQHPRSPRPPRRARPST